MNLKKRLKKLKNIKLKGNKLKVILALYLGSLCATFTVLPLYFISGITNPLYLLSIILFLTPLFGCVIIIKTMYHWFIKGVVRNG